ncbi:MAG: hypothetical protein ACE5ID_04150, partial [Acidobacteriota bacterium]
TGLAFPDTAVTHEVDDPGAGAPAVSRAIDIENLFLEVRETGETSAHPATKLFYATVDLVGDPAGKLNDGTRVDLFIDFNEEGLAETFNEPGKKSPEDLTLSATLKREGKDPLKATFSGLKGLGTYSKIDTSEGRVVFAVPLADLLDSVDNQRLRASDVGGHRRRVLIWAASSRAKDLDRVPNTNDGGSPTVAGEVVKFTFQDIPAPSSAD